MSPVTSLILIALSLAMAHPPRRRAGPAPSPSPSPRPAPAPSPRPAPSPSPRPAPTPSPTPSADEAKRIARLIEQSKHESADILDPRDQSTELDALEIAVNEAVEAADREAREAQQNTRTVERDVYGANPEPEPEPDLLDQAQTLEDLSEVTEQPLNMSISEDEIRNYSGPAPEPYAPQPSLIPAGYDPEGARRMAPSLARHLKNKGMANYDRRLLQDFQRKAGIDADRIYGGQSWGALQYFGGTDAPRAFFEPRVLIPYTPPA